MNDGPRRTQSELAESGGVSQASPRSPHGLAVGALPIAVVGANDPASTRLVYAMVLGLAVVGIAFILLGIWLIRQTRVDLPVLAPLERMGERNWQHRDAPTQRRLLDEVRPPGATPLRLERTPPSVDAEFGHRRPPESLSDLGPGLSESGAPEPTEAGTTNDTDVATSEPSGSSKAGADDQAVAETEHIDGRFDETPEAGDERPEISTETAG